MKITARSNPLSTKRRLASVICSSLGGSLNYSQANMMHPYTSGNLKEFILDDTKNSNH